MTTGVDAYSTTAASNGTLGATDYFKEGQAPSTVNDAARQVMADIAAWYGQAKAPHYLTGTAGTNTVTATGPASMAAYAAGQFFMFIPANTNTGATTLNITPSGGAALGAKNIFGGNSALVGGEVRANIPVMVFYDGTQFQLVVNIAKQPTRQTFTSGSGTYTTPAGATRISARLVGGGGGGAGSGTTPGAGGAGGNTTFSTATAGGGGGGTQGAVAAGGTAASGTLNIVGASGTGWTNAVNSSGGGGGASMFGGAGGGGSGQVGNTAGIAAAVNSGSGGGGGGTIGAAAGTGGGGGSGGYVEFLISSPAATLSYAVGASGAAGTLGTSGSAGGAGGSGLIVVDEFYD